jgi:hypothetical protein
MVVELSQLECIRINRPVFCHLDSCISIYGLHYAQSSHQPGHANHAVVVDFMCSLDLRSLIRNLLIYFFPLYLGEQASLHDTFSGEARGFKVGGIGGRVREGVYPLPLGCGGCAPGKFFKFQMHAGEF